MIITVFYLNCLAISPRFCQQNIRRHWSIITLEVAAISLLHKCDTKLLHFAMLPRHRRGMSQTGRHGDIAAMSQPRYRRLWNVSHIRKSHFEMHIGIRFGIPCKETSRHLRHQSKVVSRSSKYKVSRKTHKRCIPT